MEAFAAFAGGGRAGDAFELGYFYFFTKFLDDIFSRHFSAFDVVRSYEGGYCAFIGAAVECQNGDAGFVGSCHRS